MSDSSIGQQIVINLTTSLAVGTFFYILPWLTHLRSAKVSGRVTDWAGNPIRDVTVKLGHLVTATDNDGKYGFSGIRPGIYDVSFAKAGYQTVCL